MKTPRAPPGFCLKARSNGSRQAAVHGTAAVLETQAAHADSSFGSLCRPNMNSGRPKAPTRRRNHGVCWIALGTGSLAVPETVQVGELAAFEPSNEAIDFHAEADTEFVLGSAASHPHDLVLGRYSVHTSKASLQAGERHIAGIKLRLQKEGRL